MSTPAASAAAQRLTRETLNNDEFYPTITRSRNLVERALSARLPVSTTEDVRFQLLATRVQHRCTSGVQCDSCIELLADVLSRRVFPESGFKRRIETLPDVCDLVHMSQYDPRLRTDQVLRDLADRALGGLETLQRFGAEAVRHRMRTDPAYGPVNPTLFGHDALQPHLGSERQDVLEHANMVLLHQDAALRLLEGSVARAMPSDEVDRLATFRLECEARLGQVAYLPRRFTASEALASDHDRGVFPQRHEPLVESLLVTLWPRFRSHTASAHLRDAVWGELLTTSDLPCLDLRDQDGGAVENLRRLEQLTGGYPDRALTEYPELKETTRGSRTAGRRPGWDVRYEPIPSGKPLEGRDELYEFVTQFVADTGRMPTRQDVTSAALAQFELVLPGTFSEFVRHQAANFGVAYDSVSSNERALQHLAAVSFDGASRVAEWTCEQFSSSFRVDLQVRLGDSFELWLEADGEGHFFSKEVPGRWDVDRCRRNDAVKASELRARVHDLQRQGGPGGALVALHHDVLTGALAQLLDDVTLAAVVQTARDAGAWWVYVRPAGHGDMRAYPGDVPPRVLAVEGCEHLEVFVLDW